MRAKYPWDKWLAYKRSYWLCRGEHFDCMLHSMGVQIRNAATARSMRVRVVIDEKEKALHVTNLKRKRSKK